MTSEQKTLLAVLSNVLFSNSAISYEVEDWDSVFKEASHQAVLSLTYSLMEKTDIPKSILNKWCAKESADIANNIKCLHNHTLLNDWLKTENIPYVILKGASSAYYYLSPELRTMGDVDFLVKDTDLDRVGGILESKGLSKLNQDHDAHLVYRGNGMHYEMHYKVAGIPQGKPELLVKQYLQDVFDVSELKTIDGESFVLPSKFHHGLIILLHTIHHLTGEGIGLRHLCDWAVFENSLSEQEFRNTFEDSLKAIGLWKFAQILTRTSIKYLGASNREWAQLDNDDIVDELMEDILTSGNFGKKDTERAKESLLISSRGKNGVGHTGMFSQFIYSMNDRIRHIWPFTKKNYLFLVLGWFMYGFRYIGLLITGKRELTNVNHLINESERRREIYSKLKLYEV